MAWPSSGQTGDNLNAMLLFGKYFLPARASEQGNVIGLVSVCVRT